VVVAVFAVIVAFEYLTADSKVSIGPDVPYKFRIDEKVHIPDYLDHPFRSTLSTHSG